MEKNRRATATVFGFDFQVNAAIVLMLENVKDFQTLRLEGNYEDIELKMDNGKYILAQAKSIEKSSTDFRNVRKNLKKSLESLSDGAQKVNVEQLIMITNSPNPLNQDESKNIFLGTAHRSFSSLPESSQKIIKDYLKNVSHPLNLDKFMIQVLPFETDNERERYKIVKQYVDEFIGSLNVNIPGIGSKLLEMWQNDIFTNGTKNDAEIKLKKKDVMWPILVIATDLNRCDDIFADYFDSSLYDEIVYHYSELINSCCEKCEFFIKVLYDYNNFKSPKSQREKCIEFALNKWKDYSDDLNLNSIDQETQKGLIQIILYNIVRNRLTIDKVKREVNL